MWSKRAPRESTLFPSQFASRNPSAIGTELTSSEVRFELLAKCDAGRVASVGWKPSCRARRRTQTTGSHEEHRERKMITALWKCAGQRVRVLLGLVAPLQFSPARASSEVQKRGCHLGVFFHRDQSPPVWKPTKRSQESPMRRWFRLARLRKTGERSPTLGPSPRSAFGTRLRFILISSTASTKTSALACASPRVPCSGCTWYDSCHGRTGIGCKLHRQSRSS
jgi:hypothetical protein